MLINCIVITGTISGKIGGQLQIAITQFAPWHRVQGVIVQVIDLFDLTPDVRVCVEWVPNGFRQVQGIWSDKYW